MFVLVTYDIDFRGDENNAGRLRRVAKLCERYGVRVQNSVFEMELDYTQYREFRSELESKIDTKKDTVRYYLLGNSPDNRVEMAGTGSSVDVRSVLIF